MTDMPHPEHRLPAGLALRLEEICASFEAAWQAGGRPRVEEFIGPASGPEYPTLVRELVALDVHYRRRAGESPISADYAGRFTGVDPGDWASVFPVQPAAETVSQEQRQGRPSGPSGVPDGIDGYAVEAELGRGAMGVVYRARQLALGRTVALKMILAGDHASEQERARFRQEAEAIARLSHPNIVQIHEVGEHDGLPFLALEFCPGGSLADRLDGTPLPPGEAARLVETLARAMQPAHEAQVVHRDLKPANVLLSADGTPKVTDFGLARKLDAATVDLAATRPGAVLGTPSYMAPEQAGGRSGEVGPAADVYALGAILYECLTGRPPFKAATLHETLLQVTADEPVPPRQLQSQTPRDLETIVQKCLRKEPAQRYGSAAELADDLSRQQRGEPIRARPWGRWSRA
jgi:serine/threonine protein kinase